MLILLAFDLSAQHDQVFQISWKANWENESLHLDKKYTINQQQDTIALEQVRFYVSAFQWIKNGQVVWEESNSYHLIDISEPTSQAWTLEWPKKLEADHIRFTLGIDSTTQNSGVHGGALDPMHGMYWTWQTGYIHMKLEGKSNVCATRQHRFQLHLGGFSAPNNSIQSITLPLLHSNKAEILIDWKQFFESWDLSEENEIMSPGEKAMRCSQFISTLFQSK